MILAIDIGNTNIVIGCTQEENVLFVERVSTNISKTELEYVVEFKTLFDLYQIKTKEITGCIISSVVPQLDYTLERMCVNYLKIKPLSLAPGLKTGLNLRLVKTLRRCCAKNCQQMQRPELKKYMKLLMKFVL